MLGELLFQLIGIRRLGYPGTLLREEPRRGVRIWDSLLVLFEKRHRGEDETAIAPIIAIYNSDARKRFGSGFPREKGATHTSRLLE